MFLLISILKLIIAVRLGILSYISMHTRKSNYTNSMVLVDIHIKANHTQVCFEHMLPIKVAIPFSNVHND